MGDSMDEAFRTTGRVISHDWALMHYVSNWRGYGPAVRFLREAEPSMDRDYIKHREALREVDE